MANCVVFVVWIGILLVGPSFVVGRTFTLSRIGDWWVGSVLNMKDTDRETQTDEAQASQKSGAISFVVWIQKSKPRSSLTGQRIDREARKAKVETRIDPLKKLRKPYIVVCCNGYGQTDSWRRCKSKRRNRSMTSQHALEIFNRKKKLNGWEVRNTNRPKDTEFSPAYWWAIFGLWYVRFFSHTQQQHRASISLCLSVCLSVSLFSIPLFPRLSHLLRSPIFHLMCIICCV